MINNNNDSVTKYDKFFCLPELLVTVLVHGIRREFWFLRIKLVSGVFIYQNKGNFLEIYVINVNKLFSVTFYFMKLFNIFYYPIFSQIMGGHHMFFHVIH